MSTHNNTSHVFKGIHEMVGKMKPLKAKKNPVVAAVCGGTFGALAIGLYLQSWTDFFIPIGIWLLILILGIPTGETLLLTAPIVCAAYAFCRVMTSNAKLDAMNGVTKQPGV